MAELYSMKFRLALVALVAVTILVSVVCTLPADASSSTSTQAQVEILPMGNTSCGYAILSYQNALLPLLARYEADGLGAAILHNGRIDLKLAHTLNGTNTISVWVAKLGLRQSSMKVYVSADGSDWRYVANEKITSPEFVQYNYCGDFGDVRFIRILHNGSGLSLLLLDAVCARGR